MKNIARSFLVLLLCAGFSVPLVSRAEGLTEAQINAILGLLSSFGADQSVVANVNTSLRGGLPSVPSAGSTSSAKKCVVLTYNLYAGQTNARTNGEVSRLQEFLGINPTGYFGPLTEDAVQEWQSKNGVVSSGSPDTTGFGYVGPATRKKMACTPVFVPITVPTPPVVVNGQSPMCTIATDKGTEANPYVLGETITVSWKSQNASYAQFISDTSGKDTLSLPGDKLPASGSQTLTASVLGNSVIQMMFYGQDGKTLCSQKIVVGSATAEKPWASIDQSSLRSTSGLPTISGSAGGTSYVGLAISDGGKVYGSGMYPVINGRWSIPILADKISLPGNPGVLTPGTYYVYVYDANNTQLAWGTLTIIESQAGIASIDTSSLLQNTNNFTITGTAPNASAVIVTLVSGGYIGGKDWISIGGILQGRNLVTTQDGHSFYSYTVPVTGARRFEARFINVPAGSYTVLVHNSDYAQYALLASGTLTINGVIANSSGILTETQIQSILSLLRSYGASQSIESYSEAAMRGGKVYSPIVSQTTLTESQIAALQLLATSFGASASILENLSAALRGGTTTQ